MYLCYNQATAYLSLHPYVIICHLTTLTFIVLLFLNLHCFSPPPPALLPSLILFLLFLSVQHIKAQRMPRVLVTHPSCVPACVCLFVCMCACVSVCSLAWHGETNRFVFTPLLPTQRGLLGNCQDDPLSVMHTSAGFPHSLSDHYKHVHCVGMSVCPVCMFFCVDVQNQSQVWMHFLMQDSGNHLSKPLTDTERHMREER